MVYHDWLIQIQDMHEDGLLILIIEIPREFFVTGMPG